MVDTVYIAEAIGVTTTYVSQMVREETIPKHCVVPGTGNGKVWKFYREPIEKWLASR